jgi:perosamine synthetase
MIPVSKPYFDGKEAEYLQDAINSGYLTWHGKFVKLFTDKFAEYTGVDYAIACNTGTSAIHLCLLALGITTGDNVITTNLTFASTVFAISYCGATPVLVDIGDDWNIDVNKIEERITPKTKAIIAVHLYGHPCNMPAIMQIARKHNLYVVEDCAEAIGAKSGDKLVTKKVGSIGDIAAFSFFGNKVITTGEGGMVVTNNKDLAGKVEYYTNQAQVGRYYHTDVGYNYRMTNLQAAVGLAQLEKIGLILDRRRLLRDRYNSNLSGLGLKLMPSEFNDINWLYSLEVYRRDELIDRLSKLEIDSRPFFRPMDSLPMYKTDFKFPKSLEASENGINLPTYCDLSYDNIDMICTVIRKHVKLYE